MLASSDLTDGRDTRESVQKLKKKIDGNFLCGWREIEEEKVQKMIEEDENHEIKGKRILMREKREMRS